MLDVGKRAAAQPMLALVELARPHRYAGNRTKRGCEHRAVVQPMALGLGERLMTAFACDRERDER